MVELVGEAADALLAKFADLGIAVRADLVRIGVVLHDAGKILHAGELEGGGDEHEPAGERRLIEHGVSPELARICLSHARWAQMTVTIEELLVALADKLWKGVCSSALEELVIDRTGATLGTDRWAHFVDLDTLFEEIAAGGTNKLNRSRC